MSAAVYIGPEFVVRTMELTFGQPYLYIFFAVAFVLERIMPADRQQPVLSAGFVQDLLWFLVFSTAGAAAMMLLGAVLDLYYDRYLSFLTIDVTRSWPVWVRAVVFIVVLDLLIWTTHYLHHKIPLLWYFHLIHHSQRQMSFFTEEREHLVERALNIVVRFLPMAIFGLSFPQNAYLGLALSWYTWVYHANIRTNLGPLKYVLVTPQSHRIHHSIELQHWDKNFSAFLTLWDRVFGTFHARYDEYPTTGIPNTCFPYEQETGRRNPLVTFWRQFIYPLRLMLGYQPTKVMPDDTLSPT
jgi:sterol desaturase/sphingolipid hydroxylase (fatty acid hydroxylase superfamily)